VRKGWEIEDYVEVWTISNIESKLTYRLNKTEKGDYKAERLKLHLYLDRKKNYCNVSIVIKKKIENINDKKHKLWSGH